MKTRLLLSLFLLTCFWNCTTDTVPATKSEKGEAYEAIDGQIAQWQEDLKVPNVGLSIIEDGRVVKHKVFGVPDSSTMIPEDMLFNVASVTKVVFTATVLKLIENGDLDLNETLHPYFVDPDVVDDERHKQLTAYHLLTQQSGFANNWRWDHPTEKLTFDALPGTKYNYSGEGMEYLQHALEKKHKISLAKLADSLLFQPLGMTHTSHNWDGKRDFENFSLAYNTKGELHEIEDHSAYESAADDLVTTIPDLSKFATYMLDQINGDGEVYDQMTEIHASISPNMNQGLGWRMVNDLRNGEYAIQHGGNDIGVAALVVLLPESNRGVVVLTNGDNGALMCNKVIRAVFPEVGDEIIHKSYKSGEIKVPLEVSQEQLGEYAGIYSQPSGRKLDITTIDNGLRLVMDGIPNLNFYLENEDVLFSPDFDFQLDFVRNSEGNIIETSLSFEGNNMIKCSKE